MPIRSVLFDFDGVLIDSLPCMEVAWQSVMQTFPITTTFQAYTSHIGRPFLSILSLLNIPKELPLGFYFDSYDYFPVKCHGGITFQSTDDELFNVIGFDCAHSWDLIPKMLEFDSTHGDRNTYKDKDFVISETNSIVDQIIEFKEVKRHLKIKNLLKDI